MTDEKENKKNGINDFLNKYLSKKIKLAEKIFFVQQLGVMLKAGISLSTGLKTLAEQSNSKTLKKILVDLQQSVEKGNPLSIGLERHRKQFGDLFINMVKAGEMSGKLEEVLNQLFIQMKKDHEIIAKVRGAMIYPLIVVCMMIAIGTLMLMYVIPTMTSVFTEMNITLPLATRILIAVSQFSVNYGLYVFILIILLLIIFKQITKRPAGKKLWHSIMLHTPIAGKIIKKVNLARFCRTMSSLLKTDIPIVQSLEITAKILGNVHYKEALLSGKEKIKKGINIEESLHQYTNIFPPVVLQMISVGEETGSLDDILEESAIFYEDDVAQTMNDLPSILEPVLMVILGIGVGAMAVAVIMPIYSLSQQL